MSCGKACPGRPPAADSRRDHFEPIPYGPRLRDEKSPLSRSGGKLPGTGEGSGVRAHGGRRPGAGAPRGNLNALKHGNTSAYNKKVLATLAAVPEVAEALVRLAERRRKQQRKTESAAAQLLAELFQRAGQIVLTPENNQLRNNQDLLRFLRAAESSLREAINQQSSDHPQRPRQSRRRGDGHRLKSDDQP